MTRLIGPINSGDAVGSAGAALNDADSPLSINGKIIAVYVKYNGSPPGTTDVVVSTKGTFPAAPSRAILTLTNKNASGWFHPQTPVMNGLGVAVTFNGSNELYQEIPVDDHINVSIDDADAPDNVDVWIMVE